MFRFAFAKFPKRTAAASAEADPESIEVLRLRAETPKTAGKLQQAGVKFAFQSGGMTSINDFYTNAGKAVENGLSKDAAVRAMTLNAAEILGVENRLGSIEKGKSQFDGRPRRIFGRIKR